MALHYKLEADVELKATAEQFYNTFAKQSHQVPNASPNWINKVDVHQGDWETHGSVKIWNFNTKEGKAETVKERVELDEENKTVRFVAVEGDMLNHYKSFIATLKITPKDDGSVVKITIELEKLEENAPDAYKYLDVVIAVMKDTDAHLIKAG